MSDLRNLNFQQNFGDHFFAKDQKSAFSVKYRTPVRKVASHILRNFAENPLTHVQRRRGKTALTSRDSNGDTNDTDELIRENSWDSFDEESQNIEKKELKERSDFNPLVAWVTDAVTDDRGVTLIPVKLSDSLTKYR